MICPQCKHPRARVLRTRPDPDYPAREVIWECRSPGCRIVFASHDAVTHVIKTRPTPDIFGDLVPRILAMPAHLRAELVNLINAL